MKILIGNSYWCVTENIKIWVVGLADNKKLLVQDIDGNLYNILENELEEV